MVGHFMIDEDGQGTERAKRRVRLDLEAMATSTSRAPRCARSGSRKHRKRESDRACPHGVQFYDVVIDNVRHERVAWSYESPRPRMKQVARRFGFWEDVEVG
jgi:hypothetical protein